MKQLFLKSGNQDLNWHYAEVSIYGSTFKNDYVIRLTGESGGFLSDLALDDISVSSGLCPLEGKYFSL